MVASLFSSVDAIHAQSASDSSISLNSGRCSNEDGSAVVASEVEGSIGSRALEVDGGTVDEEVGEEG
jgi:hypothetical protein